MTCVNSTNQLKYLSMSMLHKQDSSPRLCRENALVRGMFVRGMQAGVVWIIPLPLIPLTSPRLFLNAKPQGREVAKKFFSVFAVLFRRIAHFWQSFSSARSAPLRDALDKGIWLRLCRAVSLRLRVFALKGLSLSVPSAKSVVQFFWVVAGRAAPFEPFLRQICPSSFP